MTTCTWKDCTAAGTAPQLDRNGTEWALLCDDHAKELDAALDTMKPKPVLRAWARAGHGHQSREDLKKTAVEGAVRIARAFSDHTVKGHNDEPTD